MRELLEGRASPGALASTVLVFVPVFNVDGHERFGAWNRPNQRGPEEMGWRTTAQNLNLNRDHAKADAPEMRALLGLLNAWDPILYADLHVTNGAELREDLSVEVEPGDGWDVGLGLTGHALRDAVLTRLRARASTPLPFYPSSSTTTTRNRASRRGLPAPVQPGATGPARNRFGALVETHSWQPYPRAGAATRETILAMVDLAARDGASGSSRPARPTIARAPWPASPWR